MATELDLLAKIAVTGLADVTLPTGVGRFDNDPFTLPRSGSNYATHLVSQHKRILHPILTDAAVFKPVQIRTAQSNRRYANKFLAGARHGLRFCVQSDVASTVEA